MSRTKVRNYATTESVKNLINDYFQSCEEAVLEDLLIKTGFSSIEELRHAERNMYFGFDCGWVTLATTNPLQEQEWIKDNGKYSAEVWGLKFPYDCQSVTCKKIQAEKAITDLGLSHKYYSKIKLD